MSSLYERKRRDVRFNDTDQFWTHSEKCLQSILEGGGDYDKLAECFRKGYPLNNLYRLLNSDDDGCIEIGILMLKEIGENARYFIDTLALIMNQSCMSHKYHGMEILLDHAVEKDQFANWTLFSLADIPILTSNDDPLNFQMLFCSKVIHCLSLVNSGQLQGAKKYLQNNIPNSQHLYAIDFYLKNYNNPEKILELMRSENILYAKYAVAMGAKYYTTITSMKECALKIYDVSVKEYLLRYCDISKENIRNLENRPGQMTKLAKSKSLTEFRV